MSIKVYGSQASDQSLALMDINQHAWGPRTASWATVEMIRADEINGAYELLNGDVKYRFMIDHASTGPIQLNETPRRGNTIKAKVLLQ